MVRFANGNYAVTQDDNSVAGASPSLPERVIIVDKTGKKIYNSTVATTGIHGDAGDGTHAVFGSYIGILVINQSGEQSLIPYPSDFTATDIIGTVYYSSFANKYYGKSSKRGVFEIDITAKTVKSILTSDQVQQVDFNSKEDKMLVLLRSGQLKVWNIPSGTLSVDKSIVSDFTADASKPYFVASENYIYLTSPSTSEVVQYKLSDFSVQNRFKVSERPYRIALIGAELDE